MRKKDMQLEDLTCPTCVNKIEKALIKKKGVLEAKVLFNATKIKVTYDESLVEKEELIDIMNGLGYKIID